MLPSYKPFALIEGDRQGASDNLEKWQRKRAKAKGISIAVGSLFAMAGGADFAVDTLNRASHSMKMKFVRPVGIGCPAPILSQHPKRCDSQPLPSLVRR